MIAASGFRDYDARWLYPDQIDLEGMAAVGLGLGTQMHRHGLRPEIVVGQDFRAYSIDVKAALIAGLVEAGIMVRDIGLALTPTAYFAQIHLGAPAVAMVTASHNPNGWTGVKMGFEAPLTHGPEEMAELREIVLGGAAKARAGGGQEAVAGVAEAYIDDLTAGVRLARPLRVVCATGNGTAGAFAPEVLARIGAEVIPLHTELDADFPYYNPNPEALEMLHDMARAQRAAGANLALGFDGDGDRCGVVDDQGEEIYADKLGLLFARDLVAEHPGAGFVVDVKSTGLFASDPVLKAAGAKVEYWKTGHSHMKRRVRATGALAGFEKSGHHIFAPPLGRGYDCALRVAVRLCQLLDRTGARLSDLRRALPQSFASPTMSPACPDADKRAVLARIVDRLQALAKAGGQLGGQLGGRAITGITTVDGARVMLEGGGFALVRASSNTPNLVVVCESLVSQAELAAIFASLDAVIRTEPLVGAYDQELGPKT